MAKEVLTLAADGNVGTEFIGFQGKACLKQAAEISKELEALGIVTSLDAVQMKDTSQVATEEVAQTIKVERS
jgi:hypothetical protein